MPHDMLVSSFLINKENNMADRLPDPYTVPAGPGFKTATLTSKDFTMSHELNGAAVVTAKTIGQSWHITVTYNTMTPAQFDTLDSFIIGLNGPSTALDILLPQYKRPKGGSIGAVPSSTRPTTTFDGSVISIANFTSIADYQNVTPGSLIQFSNSTKVYTIIKLQDEGSGTYQLTLNTKLYMPIGTATIPKLSDIEFQVKLSASPSITTNEDGLIEGFSLQFKESTI